MKINLRCGDDIRTGYVNVDNVPANIDYYRQGEIQSLDWLTNDSTVDEIVANNCLETISYDKLSDVLNNWYSKLTKDGLLKITAQDCCVVYDGFLNGQINIAEFNHMVFDNDKRRSVIDHISLQNLIEEVGFIIQYMRFDGYCFYLEAVKC